MMKAERRLIVSSQRKDTDALNQIRADEYPGTAPKRRVVNKADLMAVVQGDAIQPGDIECNELKLRLSGNIGIVTGLAKAKARVSEEDFSGLYRGGDIFIKRETGRHPTGVHAVRLSGLRVKSKR